MVITQTPFRISFFGGGTDFPAFYEQYGGQVLSTSFDKYCYLTVRHLPPFFDYSNYIAYSKCERTREVDEIQHPAVREAMKAMDMHDMIVLYDADLPARTGLGTSSSFAVGLLAAFYALKGKYVDKRRLADEAIHLERVLCNEKGGVQDQIAASFGGFNKIIFGPNGYEVCPVVIGKDTKDRLNDNLLLFFTGLSRFSSELQAEQEKNIDQKTRQLLRMKGLVDEAEKALVERRVDDFGRLLDEEWRLKQEVNGRVSNPLINDYYARAMAAGALGGKLLGAGGGGFLLFYVPEEHKASVRSALGNLMEIPFRFEEGGVRIIYYVPEIYDPNKGKVQGL